MLLLHRIMINVRRIFVLTYYKLIFNCKFEYGKHFRVRGSFRIYIEPTGHIKFGNNCFINNNFSATSIEEIVIGDDCVIGEGVKIYDHNHKYRNKEKTIAEQGFTAKKVSIGSNCWIASNVTILAGVTIGDNCVIGANCLVYKDVPADSVVKHGEPLILGGYNES